MHSKEPKFTKGPWFAVEARGFTTNRKLIQSANGEDIAATCFHDPEDTIANAELIAASPELYVALGKASELLANLLNDIEIRNENDIADPAGMAVVAEHRPQVEAFEALLAKARGEASNGK